LVFRAFEASVDILISGFIPVVCSYLSMFFVIVWLHSISAVVFSSEDDSDVSDGEEDSFQYCKYVDMGARRKAKPKKRRIARSAPVVSDEEMEAELPPLSPTPQRSAASPAEPRQAKLSSFFATTKKTTGG